MADTRTYNEKLADKHGGLRGDNTRDAQKVGKPGEPKKP